MAPTVTSPRTAFQQEVISDQFLAEAWPLLQSHKDEIAHFADIPLDPDVDAYLNMQALGKLRLYTVRTLPTWDGGRVVETSRLVGYAVFIVAPNAHYRSSLQATQDVLYLDPEFRGPLGAEFITHCEDWLRSEGVQAVYQHLKVRFDHPRLMAKLGYEHVDNLYVKRLDR